MRFETAEIDRYGPLKGCRPEYGDQITIIAGPNESGKTLYLEGLLQLLDPGVETHMTPGPRVDETPTGRLVLDNGSDLHTLGNGTALSDISPIEPVHLHNLFVVRDSDLRLPDGQEYYTSLVEHLGDIHTSEINRIRSKLADRGRLTNTRLNLANGQDDNKAKDVRNDAKSLARDIESYLETMSETGLRETNRERLRTKQELTTVENKQETQRVAKQVADYEYAADQLQVYRETTARIQELGAFDREILDDLREVTMDISHDDEQVADLESQIKSKQKDAQDYRERLSESREKRAELQQRESDVDSVEDSLETYREKKGVDTSHESQLAQRRTITIAGIVGAGIAAAGGAIAGSTVAIAFAVLLLFVGAGGWYAHRQLTQRVVDSETHEQELLQEARDAGFDVDATEDIAPMVRDYRDGLDTVKQRIQRLEAELDSTENRILELEESHSETETRLEANQEELASRLNAAGVDSIDEYESNVNEREEKKQARAGAGQDLTREVGDPGADVPEKKIENWKGALSELESEIADTDINADQYEEGELERLNEQATILIDQLDELDEELEEHQYKLEGFERRANSLNTAPFIETELTLQAYTTDGLQALAEELHALIEVIERDAEISRKAINIFDTIRDEEEQKISTLFDPDGPASEILSHLTNGRYTAVNYDSGSKTLEVTTTDGQTLNPHQLSRGTQDQLYFAARLSLAQQLLGSEAGFLLLDDPFLAADLDRLRHGFETLSNLAEEGWQIMYLTAKQEVQELIASDFDVDVYELDPLDH